MQKEAPYRRRAIAQRKALRRAWFGSLRNALVGEEQRARYGFGNASRSPARERHDPRLWRNGVAELR